MINGLFRNNLQNVLYCGHIDYFNIYLLMYNKIIIIESLFSQLMKTPHSIEWFQLNSAEKHHSVRVEMWNSMFIQISKIKGRRLNMSMTSYENEL